MRRRRTTIGLLWALLACDDGDNPMAADAALADPSFPSSCTSATACGGDLVGTWVWQDWCRDTEGYAEPLGGRCNEFTGTVEQLVPAGEIVLQANGSYRSATAYTHRRQAEILPGCVSPGCEGEASRFIDWASEGGGGEGGGGAQVPNGWTCAQGEGEMCDCVSETVLEGAWDSWTLLGIGIRFAHEAVLEDASAGRWSVDGSTVTLINDAGRSRALWYCVDGDTLTLRDLRSDAPHDPVFVLRRQLNRRR